MNLTQPDTQDISIGQTGFIAETGPWDDAQSERAGQLPALIKEKGITTIRVVYSDQHGLMRGKALSVDNFLLALQNGVADTFSNLGKDTSNTPVFPLFEHDGGFGVEQMGGAGDMLLAPDPLTFKILPWAPDTAWIISDLYLKDRTRCPFDCRQVMRNALKSLKELEFSYIVGLELEFYVFVIEDEKLSLSESGHPPEPPAVRAISHGFQYHAEHPMDRVAHVTEIIRDMAVKLELPLRTIEAEWGPGPVRGDVQSPGRPRSGRFPAAVPLRRQAPDAASRTPGQLHGETRLTQRLFKRVAPAPVIAEYGNRRQRIHQRQQFIERCRLSLHRRTDRTRRAAKPLFPTRPSTATNASTPTRWRRTVFSGPMTTAAPCSGWSEVTPNRVPVSRTARENPRQIRTCTWPHRFMPGWTGFKTGQTRANRCRAILTSRPTSRQCPVRSWKRSKRWMDQAY